MEVTTKAKIISIYEKEKKAQAQRKADRKKEKEAKGPLIVRIGQFIKRWIIRLFYTLFFSVFVYVLIMTCTSMIPVVMGYIVGSMGYDLSSVAEVLLAGFSGLFFTAWIFTISYFLVKKAFGLYMKQIKKTIPKELLEYTEEKEQKSGK